MLKRPDHIQIEALAWLASQRQAAEIIGWLKEHRDGLRQIIEATDEDQPTLRGGSRMLGEIIAAIETAPQEVLKARVIQQRVSAPNSPTDSVHHVR